MISQNLQESQLFSILIIDLVELLLFPPEVNMNTILKKVYKHYILKHLQIATFLRQVTASITKVIIIIFTEYQ